MGVSSQKTLQVEILLLQGVGFLSQQVSEFSAAGHRASGCLCLCDCEV